MSLSIAIVERTEPTPPTGYKYDGWRVLHKAEGGYDRNPYHMPSVIPPIPSNRVDMTESVQRMSWELMHTMNNLITERVWNRCHSWDRAFNNNIGFPNINGGTPRRDYVNNTDMAAPLPGYDKAQRLCGGLFVRGDVVGDKLVLTAGKHGIDGNSPLPDVKTIIDNNWFVYGLNTGTDGGYHWDQGRGGPVVFPLIFTGQISFPLVYFERWQSDRLPDPQKIGG